MKVSELRAERAKQAAEARKLVELAVSESRDNNPAEQTAIDTAFKAIEGLDTRIASLERLDKLDEENQRSQGRKTEPPKPGEDILADTHHSYSLLRAYRMLLGVEKMNGIEFECSQEIATRSGKPATGLWVPFSLADTRFKRQARDYSQRDLTTTTGAGAVPAILGTELVELLRAKTQLVNLGARLMTGLTGGTFALPRQNTGATTAWVTEGNAPAASNATVGQVVWSGKTLASTTVVTRKFVLQSAIDAEALCRDDLTQQIARELDRVGVAGSGGTQPQGILGNTNVPTVVIANPDGGNPTWASIIALEKTVAVGNADFGKLAFLTSNAGRAILKTTPKVSGATPYPIFIAEDAMGVPGESRMANYRMLTTELVPSNLTKGAGTNLSAIIFGNWDSATYAMWSGIDIIVDGMSLSTSGGLRITALVDTDFQLRWDQSFAKIIDLKTT